MGQSIFLVYFRALGEMYVVRVIGKAGQAQVFLASARALLLRTYPDLKQATVAMVDYSLLAPQVEKMDGEDDR